MKNEPISKDSALNKVVNIFDWMDRSVFFRPRYAAIDVLIISIIIFRPF